MPPPSSSSVNEHQLLGRVLHRRFETDRPHHKRSRTCGGCSADLMATGLPALVYTFESCACGTPAFTHLIERMWHRTCLAEVVAAEAQRLKELEVGRVRT